MTTDIEPAKDAPLAAVTPTIETIIQAAVQGGRTGAELKELLDVYERLQASRREQAFNEALAAFQAECPIIKAMHDTPQYKRVTRDGRTRPGRYAAEDDIEPIVRPYMNKHGLSLTFTGHEFNDHGQYILWYELRHREGHVYHGKGPPFDVAKAVVSREGKTAQSPPQVSSSTNTFARRVTRINALGLTTTDDHDGRDPEPEPPATIDPQQRQHIEDLLHEVGNEAEIKRVRASIVRYIGTETIGDCPADKYQAVVTKLQATLARKDGT